MLAYATLPPYATPPHALRYTPPPALRYAVCPPLRRPPYATSLPVPHYIAAALPHAAASSHAMLSRRLFYITQRQHLHAVYAVHVALGPCPPYAALLYAARPTLYRYPTLGRCPPYVTQRPRRARRSPSPARPMLRHATPLLVPRHIAAARPHTAAPSRSPLPSIPGALLQPRQSGRPSTRAPYDLVTIPPALQRPRPRPHEDVPASATMVCSAANRVAALRRPPSSPTACPVTPLSKTSHTTSPRSRVPHHAYAHTRHDENRRRRHPLSPISSPSPPRTDRNLLTRCMPPPARHPQA
ncbi:hypothetical protein MVEN_01439200 [Mycena venus]|uniref:Uncharacterized protein n=1 Tax=Mycena venus TaxID=2733690 RepID=A0A8H7CTI1_9AGAR|nr:hypothetical protein MVEN_01439200 [Mycena venus]